MSVVSFPARPYVLITTALVHETRHHTAAGTSTFRHDPPVRAFWLDYVEADGRIGVWDGATYLDALAAAREWAADGVAVRDLVAGTWGRA